jgi:hypothetical protein
MGDLHLYRPSPRRGNVACTREERGGSAHGVRFVDAAGGMTCGVGLTVT